MSGETLDGSAVQKIADLAKKAVAIELLDTDDPTQKVYRKADGTLAIIILPKASHIHKAADVDSLCLYVQTCPDENHVPGDVSVWCSQQSIEVCCEGSRCKMDMLLSEQMAIIAGSQLRGVKQRDLIGFLKYGLVDCCVSNPDLARKLAKVDIELLQKSSGEVANTKVSIGKSVEAKMAGVEEFPEYVTFRVPVFANVQFDPVDIRCSFEIIPDRGLFSIKPLPQQYSDAIEAGVDSLIAEVKAGLAKLKVDGVNVYRGVAYAEKI